MLAYELAHVVKLEFAQVLAHGLAVVTYEFAHVLAYEFAHVPT